MNEFFIVNAFEMLKTEIDAKKLPSAMIRKLFRYLGTIAHS